ncbi:MAG: PAS domain S-box protein [Sedimentisphaerales bacterium]|nr:PAS domain S-box protein [Sedimentisphaerales bacterium]
MKTIKLLTFINFIIILLLAGLFFVYRTPWGQDTLASLILPILAGLGGISSGALTMILWGLYKHQTMVRAIEANLEDVGHLSPTQKVWNTLTPFPVQAPMPPVGIGWNRLLSSIDSLLSESQTGTSNESMGQFLCSYDSQRLLGLFDTLPDGVALADAKGIITLVNRACEGLISRNLSDFIGQSVLNMFEDVSAKSHLESILNPENSLTDNSFEVMVSGQAEQSVLGVHCHRLLQSGEAGDILLIIRDITQQKIAEEARNDFVANVSHELRSPLTNIRAYAETLLSDMVLDAKAQKEAFNVINEETSRLIRLVNDVLDMARMETGSVTLDKGEVALDRLVRQCVNDIKGSAAEKKITLQTNYHPKLPNLYADRDKLAVVIHNILTNAIKYTPDGGTVFVETNVDENFVYLKVADTGYGIPARDLNKIFEKFYRVDREEMAQITGSGLGLAISKEIVMLHGGTIEVDSEVNNGTEMLVKLPLIVTGPVLGPKVGN